MLYLLRVIGLSGVIDHYNRTVYFKVNGITWFRSLTKTLSNNDIVSLWLSNCDNGDNKIETYLHKPNKKIYLTETLFIRIFHYCWHSYIS